MGKREILVLELKLYFDMKILITKEQYRILVLKLLETLLGVLVGLLRQEKAIRITR